MSFSRRFCHDALSLCVVQANNPVTSLALAGNGISDAGVRDIVDFLQVYRHVHCNH